MDKAEYIKNRKNKKTEKLLESFQKGIYNNRLFNTVMRIGVTDVLLFEEFLEDKNMMIKRATIKLFGKFNKDLDKFNELVEDGDKQTIEAVIEALEGREDYVEMMGVMLDENSMFLNKIIFGLKAMGKEEYLTPLLFSDNDRLVNFVKKVIKNG